MFQGIVALIDTAAIFGFVICSNSYPASKQNVFCGASAPGVCGVQVYVASCPARVRTVSAENRAGVRYHFQRKIVSTFSRLKHRPPGESGGEVPGVKTVSGTGSINHLFCAGKIGN